MTVPNHKKKRSDKFPLTLHKTGQFCKKIRGKVHYFGTEKQKQCSDIWSRLPICTVVILAPPDRPPAALQL